MVVVGVAGLKIQTSSVKYTEGNMSGKKVGGVRRMKVSLNVWKS